MENNNRLEDVPEVILLDTDKLDYSNMSDEEAKDIFENTEADYWIDYNKAYGNDLF